MRKYIKTKLLTACALFLALVMLFSSCSLFFESREEPEYIEGQRLEIEKSDISYTPEQSDDITKKMASVAALFMSRRDGIAVDEELIADIELNIAGEIIPSLEGSDISYERISSLIEEVTDLINSDEIAMDASLYNDIYLMCMDKLGREKSGKMIYSSIVMYLERKADIFEKRYEEFGYEWYLTDAEKYRSLIRDMKDVLGEYEFTDAVSIVFFFATLMNGTPLISGNESSFYVDASEMLVLLKKQAGMIVDHKMSAEQWKVITRLAFELGLCEYGPSENLKDVQREMLTALKNCPEYADALGELMPEVSALYVSIVDKLNEGSLTLIMSGNREVATREILRLISLCRMRSATSASSSSFCT
jgi:hypothetical protein